MSKDASIPRKRCPKCQTVYEGEDVSSLYSCDQCGNGYLTLMPPKVPDADQDPAHRLPRSGGGGETITHTRDGF